MSNLYIYNSGINWDNPQRYSYSVFHGMPFIMDYINSREEAINVLRSEISTKPVLQKILMQKECFGKTESLLHNYLINTNQSEKDLSLLDFFIKKFEVSRKIYTSYSSDGKPTSENFKKIVNYCLLSLCCQDYFVKKNHYQALNTSLKINDFLISVFEKKMSMDSILLLQVSLTQELDLIKGLINTKL